MFFREENKEFYQKSTLSMAEITRITEKQIVDELTSIAEKRINRNHTRSSLKMRKGVRSDKVVEIPNVWIGNSNDNRENISPISQRQPTKRSLVYDEVNSLTTSLFQLLIKEKKFCQIKFMNF